MKPSDYVVKYQLFKGGWQLKENEFIADLSIDFLTLLEVGNGMSNIKGYENAVRAIRMKWDGINKKTVGQLPERLWNYFYATIVAKKRDQLFPKEMAKRREAERAREEWKRKEREEYNGFFSYGFFADDFIKQLFATLLLEQFVPTESFRILNLSTTASVDEVKDSYRKLSLIHHPDKGGKMDDFVKITEAKNKCLIYLQNKV